MDRIAGRYLALMDITGTTILAGIIGDPVGHSLSPVIHNSAFRHLGIDWCYLAFRVTPDGLTDAIAGVRALGIQGLNVTMPHKTAVIPLLDRLDESASIPGAVNTISREGDLLVGYNTDGSGFLQALKQEMGFDPRGKKVLMLGAGGAARSAGVSLVLAGCSSMVVANRTRSRGLELVRAVNHAQEAARGPNRVCPEFMEPGAGLQAVAESAHLVINATPLDDLAGSEFMVEPFRFREGSLLCDLKYRESGSSFLQQAATVGVKVMDGLGMLLYQAALAFTIWTGQDPPLEIMKEALPRPLAHGAADYSE